jgi:hypothetical protein
VASSFRFSTLKIMLFVNKDSLISSFPIMCTFYFIFLSFALGRTSGKKLKSISERRSLLCSFLDLSGKPSSFSLVSH